MTFSRIVGTGSYLPERVLTNSDLERMVDTSDAWITSRTGIRQRHIAADNEKVSDLALVAGKRALASAGLGADDIDLIVLATTTPDMIFPSSACFLQAKLGNQRGAAFDIQAVCSGFVYALAVADRFIRTGGAKNALVVGAEIYSRILDWNDRGTCVLFGDGAGAVVLTRAEEPGVYATRLHSDGRYASVLQVPGAVDHGAVSGRPFVEMEGGTVFKFAVKAFDEVSRETLAACGLAPGDVDWFIPHQANTRIMSASAHKLGIDEARVVSTVDRHGNTSAASIPLAMDIAVRDGRIKVGQRLLLAAVGGGFTWGAAVLRY